MNLDEILDEICPYLPLPCKGVCLRGWLPGSMRGSVDFEGLRIGSPGKAINQLYRLVRLPDHPWQGSTDAPEDLSIALGG